MLPRDFTEQEKLVARCLSEFGFRYEQQYEIGKYTVDFYLPNEKWVVEADGIHGHFRKSDKKRDEDLHSLGAMNVVHIKGNSYSAIESEMLDALEKGW